MDEKVGVGSDVLGEAEAVGETDSAESSRQSAAVQSVSSAEAGAALKNTAAAPRIKPTIAKASGIVPPLESRRLPNQTRETPIPRAGTAICLVRELIQASSRPWEVSGRSAVTSGIGEIPAVYPARRWWSMPVNQPRSTWHCGQWNIGRSRVGGPIGATATGPPQRRQGFPARA